MYSGHEHEAGSKVFLGDIVKDLKTMNSELRKAAGSFYCLSVSSGQGSLELQCQAQNRRITALRALSGPTVKKVKSLNVSLLCCLEILLLLTSCCILVPAQE